MIINGVNTYEFNENRPINGNGKSKFSVVFLGKNTVTNQKVVIKRLNKNLKNINNAIIRFKNESQNIYEHNNIQKIIESFKFQDDYFIILQFIEGINLQLFSKKNKKLLRSDYALIKNIVIDILSGLKYMHDNSFVHGDIKPSNIIITKINDSYKATIIDFGQSRKIGKRIDNGITHFAMLYSPPEMLLKVNSLINNKSDIYSLGVTMYDVLTGVFPYNDNNPLKLMMLQLNYNIQPHKLLSPDIYKVIRKATAKYVFPKPLRFYSNSEIYLNLIKGQSMRYENVDKFIEALRLIY